MIETTRLLLRPLNVKELRIYLQAEDQFEAGAGLACTGRKVMPSIRHFVEKFTLPKMMDATGDHFLFFTFWLVILKSDRLIVGELGFKGIPNVRREIEIGYGTMPAHQSKGYMTEAVSGMIRWAKARPDVAMMVAETDEVNHGSIRVLRKNRFTQYDRKGNMLWWKCACE